MKILHVVSPGIIAGLEKSVLSGVKALLDAGHIASIAVVVESRQPMFGEEFISRARAMGIECHAIPSRSRFDMKPPSLLLKRMQFLGVNIVHSHGYKPLAYLSVIRNSLPPVVATFHGATGHTSAVQLYERLQWIMFQKVDCLFVVSDGARFALEINGKMRCRTEIVPNMLSESPESFEQTRPIVPPIRFLFLGRLSTEKGADVLLRALRPLNFTVDIRVEVVGDGPEFGNLKKAADEYWLNHIVTFHGYQSKIASFLNDADVLIMPSRSEGLPMTLIEAAAAGLPVVGSNVGGVPDIVVQGENGILVKPDDPQSLNQAIIEMSKKIDAFKTRADAKRLGIIDQYSPKRWAEKVISIYRQLVS